MPYPSCRKIALDWFSKELVGWKKGRGGQQHDRGHLPVKPFSLQNKCSAKNHLVEKSKCPIVNAGLGLPEEALGAFYSNQERSHGGKWHVDTVVWKHLIWNFLFVNNTIQDGRHSSWSLHVPIYLQFHPWVDLKPFVLDPSAQHLILSIKLGKALAAGLPRGFTRSYCLSVGEGRGLPKISLPLHSKVRLTLTPTLKPAAACSPTLFCGRKAGN